MNWILSSLVIFGSVSQEVREVVESAERQIDHEAVEFFKDLRREEKQEGSNKCKKCRQIELSSDQENNLLVFMSFSIPFESWLEWDRLVQKKGGVFVLRGIPENSFQMFYKKVLNLRKLGIKAPIRIDPEAYEKYEIMEVPAAVFLEEKKYNKIVGNTLLENKPDFFLFAK